MYKTIYENPLLFKKYIESQEYTIPSKTKIIEAVIDQLDYENLEVCLVPCDNGLFYEIFKKKKENWRYTLVDKDPNLINYLRFKYQEIAIYQMEAERISELNESIEAIVSILALQHLDLYTFFRESSKLLMPFGSLIVITLNENRIESSPMRTYFRNNHNNFPSDELILNCARSCGFKLDYFLEIEFASDFRVEEIPLIFSKYSNSLLFKQSLKEIESFHNHIAASAVDGHISWNHSYSLYKLTKR